jgi:hypothetical protein
MDKRTNIKYLNLFRKSILTHFESENGRSIFLQSNCIHLNLYSYFQFTGTYYSCFFRFSTNTLREKKGQYPISEVEIPYLHVRK